MIRSFILGLLLLGVAKTSGDPAPIYINETATSVTNVDVDATIFLNRGYFVTDGVQFLSDAPWESSNTRFFTNSGVMSGTPGFRFDFIGYDGFTNAADVFLNTGSGRIVATDTVVTSVFSSGGGTVNGGLFGLGANSRIEIAANSVTNQGLISAGAGGIIKIDGQNVDLSGSGVIIESLADSGTTSGFFTGFGEADFIINGIAGFFPEVGVYDRAWGIANDTNMFLPSIVQSVGPVDVISPPFRVTNLLSGFRGNGGGTINLGGCLAQLVLQDAASFVRIDSSSETNFSIQVVVVKVNDTNIVPQVNFLNVGNEYFPAVVQLDSLATDLFTRQQVTNSIFLIDSLPIVSPTNFILAQNFGGQSGGLPTYRPINYTLTRLSPFAFGGFTRIPTNNVLVGGLLYNSDYTNQIVTNIYSGYSAQIDSSAARLPVLPGVTYKDRPGRVEIHAGDLNLNRARIRGEGLISVTASNFLGSPKALVDAPHFDYSLASPVKDLTITNLAPETVQRLAGPITAYSALWTNLTGEIVQVGTNSVTNVIEVKFHLLMVDGSGLATIAPVVVHNLNLRSATASSSIELQDNLFVGDTLRIEATNVSVQGRLLLDAGVPLDATSLIGIQNFTNNGTIALPSLAQFGGNTSGGLTDTNGRLSNFINHGAIQSLATLIRSDYFENSGSIVSTNNSRFTATNDFCLLTVQQFTNASSSIGAIEVDARVAKFNGGSLGTEGEVRLLGGTAKLNNQAVIAGGGIQLGLTNVLTDTGPDAGNVWLTENGFEMTGVPVNSGNLFGTHITSEASDFSIVHHSWGAVDLGTNLAGFTNNLAIGQLTLNSGFAGLFQFSGAGGHKAIYIDSLEFRGDVATDLATLQDSVELDNIEVYYADVRSTNSTITAETLNGLKLGSGSLHWISSFAGPNSSVDVLVRANGQTNTIQVNRALRQSALIDSNNNGIPNAFDPFPFDPAGLNAAPRIFRIAVTGTPPQVELAFNTTVAGTYRLEATDSLASDSWQFVTMYRKTNNDPAMATVTDKNMSNNVFRYYRVIYNP